MTMAAPPYSAESEAIMANEKMTMRTFLNGVLATEGLAPELAEFATAEIEKIKEKNEKRRNSLTPAQAENEVLKAKFVETATGKGKVKTYTLTGVEFVPKQAAEKAEN